MKHHGRSRLVFFLILSNVLFASILIWILQTNSEFLRGKELYIRSKWILNYSKPVSENAKDLYIPPKWILNHSEPDLVSFTDSNNETGYSQFIVPNIIHFIRINQPKMTFVEMICIKSAYLNHRPDKIMIHCDDCNFKGKYWDHIKDIPSLTLNKVSPPTEIYGIKFANIWHRMDILRILTLMRYGGIFLDNDVYVVQSLNRFRQFEMNIGWDYRDF